MDALWPPLASFFGFISRTRTLDFLDLVFLVLVIYELRLVWLNFSSFRSVFRRLRVHIISKRTQVVKF
jgi:hypothetical protein